MSYFKYTEEQFYKITGIVMFQFDLDLYAVTAYSDRYGKEINDPWHSATISFDSLRPEESVKHYGKKLVKEWMEKVEVYIEKNGVPQTAHQLFMLLANPQQQLTLPTTGQFDEQLDGQFADNEDFDICEYFGQYQT